MSEEDDDDSRRNEYQSDKKKEPHKRKCKYAKPLEGTELLTPRTLEKKTRHKDQMLEVLGERKLKVGAFGKVESLDALRSWKIQTNAQQSPQIKKLKEDMVERKEAMLYFTEKNILSAIFVDKDGEEHKVIPETAVVAGTIERVAREVIEKAAEHLNRKKKGLWSKLGKPYKCFGNPALSIPRSSPTPTEEGKCAFFIPSPRLSDELQATFEGTTKYRQRREFILSCSKAHIDTQGMLLKMGLHGICRFPKEKLVKANAIRKTVKIGGIYGHGKDIDATLEDDSFEGTTRLRLYKHQLPSHSWTTTSSINEAPISLEKLKKASIRNSQHTISSEEKVHQEHPTSTTTPSPEAVDMETLVFEWQKQFLLARKRLVDKLNANLKKQDIRRKHCRIFTKFTADATKMLMEHAKHGIQSGTRYIWKRCEEKEARERAASFLNRAEIESINKFYERVCVFVGNQKMDDPLMDVLVETVKRLLESGMKLTKELLSTLCFHLSKLPDHTENTGKMVVIMPILNFICKELHISAADFNAILCAHGLDWYNNSRNPSVIMSIIFQGNPLLSLE